MFCKTINEQDCDNNDIIALCLLLEGLLVGWLVVVPVVDGRKGRSVWKVVWKGEVVGYDVNLRETGKEYLW